MNTKTVMWAVIIAAVAGTSFYGGMTYGASAASAALRAAFASGAGGARFVRGGNAGGLTTGSVIAQDATSVTVLMPDGSTKIVLIGPSTTVTKTASGSLSDLSVGANVAVTGSANSDGSVTAQTIQIRPVASHTAGQ